MSEATDETDDAPQKNSKIRAIVPFFAALCAAGAGFYASSSGMILGDAKPVAAVEDSHAAHDTHVEQEYEFLPLDPVVVNLPHGSAHTHFRLVAQLEVRAESVGAISHQMPRIVDTMNTYLRALEPSDFEDRIALTRIRTHLLARIATVVGAEKVRDLLIMEFILS